MADVDRLRRDRYDPDSVTDPSPASPSAAPVPVRSAVVRVLVAVVAMIAVLTVSIQGASAAPAMPQQNPGVTSSAPVSLDTTTLAPVQTTAIGSSTTTSGAATGTNTSRVSAENRKIWLVVGGLVVVALALTLLTIRFWRMTRPVVRSAAPGPEAARSADAVAQTDEAPAVAAVDPVSLAHDSPAAAATEAAPVAAGRHSRRAVAGADHAAADDTWEPRGTGEQERVEIPVADRTVRPNRDQRSAAFRRAAERS